MKDEFNITIGDVTQKCKTCLNRFFFEDKIDFHYSEDVQWPRILRDVEVFKSSSDASRNGWNKKVDEGWNGLTAGKLKIKVFVWKCTKENPFYQYYQQPHNHID